MSRCLNSKSASLTSFHCILSKSMSLQHSSMSVYLRRDKCWLQWVLLTLLCLLRKAVCLLESFIKPILRFQLWFWGVAAFHQGYYCCMFSVCPFFSLFLLSLHERVLVQDLTQSGGVWGTFLRLLHLHWIFGGSLVFNSASFTVATLFVSLTSICNS